MSWALYREQPVDDHLEEVVEEAWALLPAPDQSDEHDFERWNYFVPTPGSFDTRDKRIHTVRDAVDALLAGDQPNGKVISTRYTEELPLLNHAPLEALKGQMVRFGSSASAPLPST